MWNIGCDIHACLFMISSYFRPDEAEVTRSQRDYEVKHDTKPTRTRGNCTTKHSKQVHDPERQLVQENGGHHGLVRRRGCLRFFPWLDHQLKAKPILFITQVAEEHGCARQRKESLQEPHRSKWQADHIQPINKVSQCA